MAKPDTVVTLSDDDKEWIQNKIGNIQVSISSDGDYSEILLELLICMKELLSELRAIISVYRHLHGMQE